MSSVDQLVSNAYREDGSPCTVNRPAVLVTGGAKRLGATIARIFGQAGWHVVIHYNNSQAEAEDLVATLPSAETVGFDLTDIQASITAISQLADRLLDWRSLVNCASVFELDNAKELEPHLFEHAMWVNAGTPARISQVFLSHARSSKGCRVIQITDQKISNPNPDFFSYSMSKHALAATVPMLDMALNDPQDRVYAIAPGAILASYDQSEAETERSHRMNLLKRKTLPDEIAATALFLAQGWLAGGQTVFVDSGQHLLKQPRDVLFLAREEASKDASS